MFNPLFLCVFFDKIPLGVPEKRKLFGEEEKGMECLNEFQRNSFKHGISFDVS